MPVIHYSTYKSVHTYLERAKDLPEPRLIEILVDRFIPGGGNGKAEGGLFMGIAGESREKSKEVMGWFVSEFSALMRVPAYGALFYIVAVVVLVFTAISTFYSKGQYLEIILSIAVGVALAFGYGLLTKFCASVEKYALITLPIKRGWIPLEYLKTKIEASGSIK